MSILCKWVSIACRARLPFFDQHRERERDATHVVLHMVRSGSYLPDEDKMRGRRPISALGPTDRFKETMTYHRAFAMERRRMPWLSFWRITLLDSSNAKGLDGDELWKTVLNQTMKSEEELRETIADTERGIAQEASVVEVSVELFNKKPKAIFVINSSSDGEETYLPRRKPKPTKTSIYQGFKISFLDNKSLQTTYPFALHDFFPLPLEYAVRDGKTTLTSDSCTGDAIENELLCPTCQQLAQNEKLHGIVQGLETGLHENSGFE
ncbi:hypothetical protein CPC08DRAFT_715848 [Agrocybe pediades]|nr:hypothetical protein CPC08DRAFT_715848 [Agrocybe pediades]